MARIRGPAFIGRTSERELLDGLLARVRGGESEVLVIRGEAGVGKTALLRYAARQASGFRVAELTGVEAEMELPFAGIHQLCGSMLDWLDALPAPQRDALSVALGRAAGEVPDRFLVGLAVLSLLAAVAEERPLLCLIEDAQWLDAVSSQILGLVARRVRAESVAIVVAVREPAAAHDFRALSELRLAGLPEQDAARYCAARSPAGSTAASETGWSLRPEGTRWPCWSCRDARPPPSWRVDSSFLPPASFRRTSRTTTSGGSASCQRRRNA